MVIEGEHIVLRPWETGDAASLVTYGNNRRVWRNLRDVFPHPYTEADAEAWIAMNDPFRDNFAIAKEGECIGSAGLLPKEDADCKTVEMGYWIGEPFWGQGYVTEVVELLCAYGFRELDAARIEACVFEWNLASGRVLEKNGFVLEERCVKAEIKDGVEIDTFLYGKVRS